MRLVAAALVLLALAFVAIEAQKNCVAPYVFQARQHVVDPRKNYTDRAFLSYDAYQEKVAIISEIFIENGTVPEHDAFFIVHDFRGRVRWEVNLKTKACRESHPDDRFRRFEVPPRAKYHDTFVIGTDAYPGAGCQVNRYNYFNETEKMAWEGIFTTEACIPVEDLFWDERVGAVRTNFFNVVLGISDPNIFNKPRECN